MVELILKDVPQNTYDIFMDFTKHECEDNTTMGFKTLVDNSLRYSMIMDVLSNLEQRISKLEEKPVKEIKLLSGNKLEVKRSGSI